MIPLNNNTSSVEVKKQQGFTLIEMVLVMVVISMIIVMAIRFFAQQAYTTRVDRTTMQMQQILNASLSYYVTNGAWPNNITYLANYLPLSDDQLTSPWGTNYNLFPGVITDTSNPSFGTAPLIYVYLPISAGAQTTATATIIAGRLPLAFTTTKVIPGSIPKAATCAPAATTCFVVTSVNIPGQNLNNASSVNYAGVYHNGACVPAPTCPVDPKSGKTMSPEIMVVPVSVSGVNDAGQLNIYPISSFTAYASPTIADAGTPGAGPDLCKTNVGTDKSCYTTGGSLVQPGKYWRVCLEVITEKGPVNWSNSATDNWGKYATIMAITRCSISGENTGSSFDVWSQ